MNQPLHPLIVFCIALAFSATSGFCETTSGTNSDSIHKIEPTVNKIVKITDSGITPKTISIGKRGSLLFFYNETRNSLVNVEVDYGDRKVFCSTGKMMMGKDGVVRSKEPFSPRSFATVCFPDAGSYKLTAYGVAGFPSGLSSTIEVR